MSDGWCEKCGKRASLKDGNGHYTYRCEVCREEKDTSKKEEHEYEIAMNAQETWYFTVKASSKQEALERFRSHHHSVDQTSSTGGWSAGRKAGQIKVTRVSK